VALPVQEAFSHQVPTPPYAKDAETLVKEQAGPGDYDLSRISTLTAYNIRLNPQRFETVTWDQYKSLPPEANSFLAPLGDPSDVAPTQAFVNRHVPANFKSTLTPINAAKALFVGLVNDFTYQIPEPPTYVQVHQQRKATCFGFSMTYARSLQTIGIPSRIVLGVELSKTQPVNHAWVEIYIPGIGWVPQDPTFSEGVDPEGIFPYYFNVIPRLNQRVGSGYLAPWSKEGISGLYGSTAAYRMSYESTPPVASASAQSKVTKVTS
jgi:transglutaminase-like putative cysteine protease